jgi:putative tricarboxylic transport membrane protein
VILRRDHVAGGAFVAAGVFVLAVSHDLPIGKLASPGAGMLPVLVTLLMMLFGLVIMLQGRSSPPLAEISWSDLPHAAKVSVVAAVAAALYTPLGFILSMALMLFALVYVVERRSLAAALAFSIPIPLVTYGVFEHLLKTPLERGLFWF